MELCSITNPFRQWKARALTPQPCFRAKLPGAEPWTLPHILDPVRAAPWQEIRLHSSCLFLLGSPCCASEVCYNGSLAATTSTLAPCCRRGDPKQSGPLDGPAPSSGAGAGSTLLGIADRHPCRADPASRRWAAPQRCTDAHRPVGTSASGREHCGDLLPSSRHLSTCRKRTVKAFPVRLVAKKSGLIQHRCRI